MATFFYKRPKKKTVVSERSAGGVPAFKKVEERRSSAFRLNLSSS